MASLSTLANFFNGSSTSGQPAPQLELPDIFPLAMAKERFIKADVTALFSKILTDVTERMHGLEDEYQSCFWDSCLKNDTSKGLISLIADAIYNKGDLFLVYDKPTKLLLKATPEQSAQIRKDYETKAESPVGIFVSFSNNEKIELIKLYSALQYCVVGGLNKNLNLANAIILKINDLRSSVGAFDAEQPLAQGKAIAEGLKNGKSVMVDGEDTVELPSPNIDPVIAAESYINKKLCLILGLPMSYITGESVAGLGEGDSKDTKAIERGLKNYFFSIMKPIVKGLFDVDVKYKSQDYRQISQGLEALKTFDLVSATYITDEEKRTIVMQLFDFDTPEGSDKE